MGYSAKSSRKCPVQELSNEWFQDMIFMQDKYALSTEKTSLSTGLRSHIIEAP